MLRIYYVLRGYPGLGRVMGGVALHETLRAKLGNQYQGRFASYLAGYRYLSGTCHSTLELFPDDFRLTPNAYLNPLGHESMLLAEDLQRFRPDRVVVDGEPFCIAWLKDVLGLPVTALAHPADFYNPSNNALASALFRYYFCQADQLFVHGLEPLPSEVASELKARTSLIETRTLVKPAIHVEGKRRRGGAASKGKHVVCVLGGGTDNVSQQFLEATVKIGAWTMIVARAIPDMQLTMFCTTTALRNEMLAVAGPALSNWELYGELRDATTALIAADAVVARSGRNLVSEILTLGTRALVIPVRAETYRAGEQRRNATIACQHGSAIQHSALDGGLDAFRRQFDNMLMHPVTPPRWRAGNEDLPELFASWSLPVCDVYA